MKRHGHARPARCRQAAWWRPRCGPAASRCGRGSASRPARRRRPRAAARSCRAARSSGASTVPPSTMTATAPRLDAGRNADQAGIGERIAEQPLHHRAGDGQRGADQHAEDDARQADVVDDDAVARRQRRRRRHDANSQSRTTATTEASDAPDARLNSTAAASAERQQHDREPGASRAVAVRGALVACMPNRPASVICHVPRSVADLRRHRARRRGRGRRRRCAGRSRADRRRPCGSACAPAPAGVGAIAGWANSSASVTAWSPPRSIIRMTSGLAPMIGLVGKLLVAGKALDGVDAAGQLDDAVGGGAAARGQDLAVLEAAG